jgi:hypothetical protein
MDSSAFAYLWTVVNGRTREKVARQRLPGIVQRVFRRWGAGPCAAAAGCPTRVLERTEIVRYMINEFDRCPMRLVFRCGRRLVRHTPQQRDDRCRDPLVAPSTPAIGDSASVRSRADAAGRCVPTQRLRQWRRQGVGKPRLHRCRMSAADSEALGCADRPRPGPVDDLIAKFRMCSPCTSINGSNARWVSSRSAALLAHGQLG